MEFEYKKLLELKKMKQEELNAYYKELRKYECENNLPVKGIELRKKTYCIIRTILKIDKILNRRTVKVVGDQRTQTDRPKIYACTHIGRYDIESAIESIKESAWFIMGDPGETYLNLDGLVLRLNGVSWFDMNDKYDAHTVNVRQKKILLNGGNELCFPEAAWNLDPIYPVGEIHPGVAKRAIETGAVIIPVGIEQYRGKFLKHYYTNIGKNLDFKGATVKDIDDISEIIREEMMSLKWDIWEQFGKEKRKDLNKNWNELYEEFIDSIMCDTENGYTIEEINKTKYKSDKELPQKPDEVFEFMNHLIPSKENAFLLQKKIQYDKIKPTRI